MRETTLRTLFAAGLLLWSVAGPLAADAQQMETGGYDSDFTLDDGLFEDPPEEERYRVEVIVFQQKDSYGAEGKSLVKEVTFAGPLKLLKSPDRLDTPPPPNGTKAERLASLMIPEKFFSYQSAKRRDTYVLLDKNERSLNPDAYTLNRSSTYNVLFHQGWEQRLDGKKETPWVYIDGGMAYGEHRQLEGSLRVYQSRFTHVEVKLWRADFAAELPKIPDMSTPAELAPEREPDQILLPEPPQKAEQENLELIRSLLLSAAPRVADIDHPPITSDVQNPYIQASSQSRRTVDDGFSASVLPEDTSKENPSLKPAYRAISLDLLQSSEQIRRKNLHYIDHPRIGVLVLVTPVESSEDEG